MWEVISAICLALLFVAIIKDVTKDVKAIKKAYNSPKRAFDSPEEEDQAKEALKKTFTGGVLNAFREGACGAKERNKKP